MEQGQVEYTTARLQAKSTQPLVSYSGQQKTQCLSFHCLWPAGTGHTALREWPPDPSCSIGNLGGLAFQSSSSTLSAVPLKGQPWDQRALPVFSQGLDERRHTEIWANQILTSRISSFKDR